MMKLSPAHKARLQSLVEKLQSAQPILVIGDVGLDRYTVGSVERISPEAPVPIVRVEQELLKLGLAANVADNLQALGSEPCLVGMVGADRIADDFRKILKKSGISDQHLVVDSKRRTVLKERIVSERQQLLRVDYEDVHPATAQASKKVLERVKAALSGVAVVIIEDYAKGLFDPELAGAIIAMARKQRKLVLVDPNSKSNPALYRGASLLTPNTREAEALSGIRITDPRSLKAAGAEILSRTRAASLIITRGREGMAIFEKGRATPRLIPTYAREVYDVSGAGDTVISVLALALGAGASLEDSARLANLAAAIEVGKRGTATVSRAELLEALASWA